jgi:thiol-disulfide isomerase/thioredoxin
MDRLPAVIAAAAAALAGCDSGSGAPGEPSSRVNAVKGEARRVSADELCDVRHDGDRAPRFALPPLAGPAPAAGAGWRWVNVWATWCKPCLEELPRLERWAARHAGRVELVLVSADESDATVATFRSAHPGVPDGVRLADPDALPAWLSTLGLDAASPIPIHVLVDPEGRTRCVRAGGVGDGDLAAAEALLGSAAR